MTKTLASGILLSCALLLRAQGGMGPGPGTPAAAGGPPTCPASSLPYTDSFATVGAISPCWTTVSGGTLPVISSSGVLTAAGSGADDYALFTGLSFGSTQSIKAAFTWRSGYYSALCLGYTAANGGSGVCYYPNIPGLGNMVNGSYIGSAGTCGASTSGDVIQFRTTPTTTTVIDVTTSTTICSMGSGVATGGGSPVLLVAHTGSGDSFGPATVDNH